MHFSSQVCSLFYMYIYACLCCTFSMTLDLSQVIKYFLYYKFSIFLLFRTQNNQQQTIKNNKKTTKPQTTVEKEAIDSNACAKIGLVRLVPIRIDILRGICSSLLHRQTGEFFPDKNPEYT